MAPNDHQHEQVEQTSFAELPLRIQNDSIPLFRNLGMDWELNGNNAWRNAIGMELGAFCPEWMGMEWLGI